VGELQRAVEREGRRRVLPDPLAVPGMLALQPRPLAPARDRGPGPQPEGQPGNGPRHRCRPYTIAGIEGGIADYGKVIDAMKAQMDAMPAAERREVEEASQVLRRLRAGAAGTRSPHPTSWAAGEEAEATVLAPGGAGAA